MAEIDIPYGSPGWKYKYGGAGIEPGFYATDYPDFDWPTGSMAMGLSGCGPGTLGTSWPANSYSHNSDIVIRRRLGSGLSDVTVRVRVDDDVVLYWNGTEFFNNQGRIGGTGEVLNGAVPAHLLGGTNLLALRARDRRSVCAWIDVEIVATRAETAASNPLRVPIGGNEATSQQMGTPRIYLGGNTYV